MAEQQQRKKAAPARTDEAVEEAPAASETGEKLKAELDDLLEQNAEDFVKSYVQKGGQ